jgi:NADH:ubiquinone oxidoreductase subunit F (NADH-binding)
MVDLAWYCTRFNRNESCGKCVPCRVGTASQLVMLDRIRSGIATEKDLDRLVQSSDDMIAYSLCGLGQAAPIPNLSCLKHFREEFLEHIDERRCRAGVCTFSPEPDTEPGYFGVRVRSDFILTPVGGGSE